MPDLFRRRKERGGWQWWVLAGIVALVAVLSVVTVVVSEHRRAGGRGHHRQPKPLAARNASSSSSSSSSAAAAAAAAASSSTAPPTILYPPSPASSDGGPVIKYADPLRITLMFFDVQKSGKLPAENPIRWRADSALDDGKDVGVDLSGGLYDAGDFVKFGLPMAFTATILSWSMLEYSSSYNDTQQLLKAKQTVKWITDFLVKAHPEDNVFYFQVGDPTLDHACWERAETMDTPRPSYKVDTEHPGSDVAAEAAAAMAAASLVLRNDDSPYADLLVSHARQLFDFADKYRGSYSTSFRAEQSFYNSTDYVDELLWAASWMYYATKEQDYLSYATGKLAEVSAGWGKAPAWFGWNDKVAGVQVLLSKRKLLQPQNENALFGPGLMRYKNTAEQLICAFLPQSPTATSNRTQGGMLWVTENNSIQHAVSSGYLAVVFADYLASAHSGLNCMGRKFAPQEIRAFAASQADYILGQNPLSMSYLVGHGDQYPLQLHHREASIPMNARTGCKDGFHWLRSKSPNPNVAAGGLVGGPFQNDSFNDFRDNSMQNEATTYNSATFAALLAALYANGNQQWVG